MSEQADTPRLFEGEDSKATPSGETPSDAHEPLDHGDHSQPDVHGEHGTPNKRATDRILEIATAILLGIVAVATTWSGYQAARWSGVQSADYSKASALRTESTRDSTLAGQTRLYDVTLVDEWLNAYVTGNKSLEAIYYRRFRPGFVPVFNAWLATDPFNNSQAPPGPLFMPQYNASLPGNAAQLDAEAQQMFAAGLAANERSENYVFNTVVLAMVLLLAAISERFHWRPVRVALLVIACAVLLVCLVNLLRLPIH